jgi:hypothetical protein
MYLRRSHFLITSGILLTFVVGNALGEVQNSTINFASNSLRNESPQEGDKASVSYRTDTNCWLGLQPLASTRADVERLLGVPTNSAGRTFIYEYKADKVHVIYSEGTCDLSENGRWNVPSGTVLRLKVFPQHLVTMGELKFKRSRFLRAREVHPQDWIHYINQRDGVTVDVQTRGKTEEVMSVVYEPSAAQRALRCVTERRTGRRFDLN